MKVYCDGIFKVILLAINYIKTNIRKMKTKVKFIIEEG